MIQNSFIQLPGIGAKKEISLWNDGVFSWSDFINKRKELGFRLDEDKSLSHIQTCLNNLANNQVDYFYNTLPSSEEWRLFREFQNHCLYLDIETNGGNFFSGFITTIATYDGNEIRYYVHGKNLDDFIDAVEIVEEQGVDPSRLLTSGIGLSGEVGEFNEIIKKCIFQGKEMDEDTVTHLKSECGDILWYLAQACIALDTSIE